MCFPLPDSCPMMEELDLESGDLRVIDGPSLQLFGGIVFAWTNSRERTNADEDQVALHSNNISGADMKDILTNANAKVGVTMAPCTKAYKYAVGFGIDKTQRMKTALLALAAAMACDFSNCAHIRARHPDFAESCKIICIQI